MTQIGQKIIGDGHPCFIIAEAGVNHNGRFTDAIKLIDVACAAGADAVKFQTFQAENLVTFDATKAEYQKKNDIKEETQFEMLKKLELHEEDFFRLSEHAAKKGIIFLSTAFDNKSIDIVSQLDVPCFKVPSGEITNFPYLKKIASEGKPVILSTGMSTINEIRDAITYLKQNGIKDIILLQCTTCYPAPFDSANLRVMYTLKQKFRCPVGYSDHTEGIIIPIAAVAIGACVIEKHFTLDKKDRRGPDHQASLNPDELRMLVDAIKRVESAMGNGEKIPEKCEIGNINVARKSIVASKDIARDSILNEEHLIIKRPGTGIEPKFFKDVIGKKVKELIKKDSVIRWDVLE